MAQHDMDIANQAFAATRADINSALGALVSNNSGATAPATTFPYMWWADTTAGVLKQRNAANSAWISVLNLATGFPIGAAASGANSDITSVTALQSINGGQIGGMRNRLINGSMMIDQRNNGSSFGFTAGAILAYCVDRWYGYCTGGNVTGQRVAGTSPNAYVYRFTGAASVTKIGFAQRIEAINCQDLAGTTATLSVDLSNSLLTTVTWTVWYANSADTFGTLASPTRTQIATGTFTVTSTLARYSTNITVPGAATTGIEVEFSVAAQTSGTWTIGRAQLEVGSVATAFEVRPIGEELLLCQRYLPAISGRNVFPCYAYSSTFILAQMTLPTTARVSVSSAMLAPGCTAGDFTAQGLTSRCSHSRVR